MRKQKVASNNRKHLDDESQKNAAPIPDLEKELHDLGRPIGERILDLMSYREKGSSAACSNGKRYV
jgi:hypothetical protein